MVFKFAANISTMFTEAPSLLDRYELAAKCGFSGVECQSPYDFDVDILKTAKESSAVEQVLINSYQGKIPENLEYSVGKLQEFTTSIEKSLLYAESLKCEKLHVLADQKKNVENETLELVYKQCLSNAAYQAEESGTVIVIEPLCKEVKPGYFLSNFEQALNYVKELNFSNLMLLMDIYHLQMISGNLTSTIRDAFQKIGHVQISQAPKRNEPSAPGEINYNYILSYLKYLGYSGWIGLEYHPSGLTEKSLNWIQEFGYEI